MKVHRGQFSNRFALDETPGASRSAKVIKGKIKAAVGKAAGDAKLESEGRADKIEGKVQNAVGGLKDTIKGK